MSGNYFIKFHFISKFFGDGHRFLERGENAYTSGHVVKFTLIGDVKPVILKGEVAASMKKQNYAVEISYDCEEGIKEAKCQCARGNVVCHHMAALLCYAHYNVSCTDVECQWTAPRREPNLQAVKLSDLFKGKEQYKAAKRTSTPEEIARFRESLGATNVVGFAWLLRSEPSQEATALIPDVESIINSPEYLRASNKNYFFQLKCKLSNEDIERIHQITEGQHTNENWHVARKHRLTASKFGIILAACQRNKYPPSLFKNLVEGYNLQRVAAIQWGKDHEKKALEEFTLHRGFEVKPTGLWLSTGGFLGASPDGLVGKDMIVEVKCPYKYRETVSLRESMDKNYLFFHDGESFITNSNHNYYHQVQGQLHLLNKKACHVVIWTPRDTLMFVVERDERWASNLNILENFYLTQYLPYITK